MYYTHYYHHSTTPVSHTQRYGLRPRVHDRENLNLKLHHQNVISEHILTKYRTTLQVCYFLLYVSHCVSKCAKLFCLLNDY